ncbi:MAG: DUF4292 domain-containing protein [Candidatus Dadabacteria bacterium]
MSRILILLLCIGVLASCRSTKKIQTAISKKDTSTVKVTIPEETVNDTANIINGILHQVRSNVIDYKTFSGKVNVDYTGGDGKTYNVNAVIRMYKDSAIWISANALLGFEAMRVFVTKDSVKLLNKINKTYTERSVSYLQEITELPLDLHVLQDLIVGNPVFLDSSISYYSQGNGVITLLSVGEWFKNLLTLDEKDKTLLHSKLDDAEVTRSRTADLTYTDYDRRNRVAFSTNRRIIVAEKNRLDIKMDFRQYDFNTDVSFPFSIPKNYRRE